MRGNMNQKLNRAAPNATNFFGIAERVSSLRNERPRQDAAAGHAKRAAPASAVDAERSTRVRSRFAQDSGAHAVQARPPQTSSIDAEWEEITPVVPAAYQAEALQPFAPVKEEHDPFARATPVQPFTLASVKAELFGTPTKLQPFAPATSEVESVTPVADLQPFALATDDADPLQPYGSVSARQPFAPAVERTDVEPVTSRARAPQTSFIDAEWEVEPVSGAAQNSQSREIVARPPHTSMVDTEWDAEAPTGVMHESDVREILARPPHTSMVDAEWDIATAADTASETALINEANWDDEPDRKAERAPAAVRGAHQGRDPAGNVAPRAESIGDAEWELGFFAEAAPQAEPALDEKWGSEHAADTEPVLPSRLQPKRGYMLMALLAIMAFGVIGLSDLSLSHRTTAPHARELRLVAMPSGTEILKNTSAKHAEPAAEVSRVIASVTVPAVPAASEETKPPLPEKPKVRYRRVAKPAAPQASSTAETPDETSSTKAEGTQTTVAEPSTAGDVGNSETSPAATPKPTTATPRAPAPEEPPQLR